MQDFRKLRVWQRAQETCVEVYAFTTRFPVEERYGATSQLRRAAISVGANIAEGSKRASNTDKARIFNLAQGEAAEAMSVLDVADRLGLGMPNEAIRLSLVYDELIGSIEALRQQVLAGRNATVPGDSNG
jgi:four helix bundle protein